MLAAACEAQLGGRRQRRRAIPGRTVTALRLPPGASPAGNPCSCLNTPCNPPTRCPAHQPPPLQVLLVVEQPERQAEEAAADYAKRLQNDRVLALNPNFTAE